MILNEKEIARDSRIGPPAEELRRMYGADLARVMERVFGYERKIIGFASLYFLLMTVLIGVISGTKLISATASIAIGVCSGIITTFILYLATNIRRR